MIGVTYKVNVTTNSQLLVNPGFLCQATEDYLTTQTGPLDSAGGNWVGKLTLPHKVKYTSLIMSHPRLGKATSITAIGT